MRSRLLGCSLLALVACGKSKASHADFFGNEVKPPKALAQLRPGMTIAEAMATVPGLTRERAQLELASGDPKIHLYTQNDPITQLSAHVDDTNDPMPDLASWPPPESPNHWRGSTWIAEVHPMHSSYEVDFAPKIDVKTMFAGGPAALPAPLAKVKPGMSKAEIDAVVPLLTVRHRQLPDELTFVGFANEDKPGGMTGISMALHPDHRSELIALWGPGEASKGADGRETHVWHSASGWKATLSLANKGEVNLGRPAVDSLVYEADAPAQPAPPPATPIPPTPPPTAK